ncbi:hypothetical protein SLNWT_3284 [Streptomyces albus]|uniref:Uncharacterized protein n=1 Tax=Streptomyces albus (strain ATCC 21838 / DSM 41398 / FERM P-419 / JCM 4703 / NBRC 107858) TaxID=1081613 RepID=A0A0B5EWS4_STRA4|nr:hypothetical protein SLNWT_3284 [Streptomyces albus]AOU77968.1 hypothetical protein SLNHY_3277 [Streptomyces albus]AYN33723.1 hypothetical protein DUI70_3222 [Streptomyces albus]
MGGRSGGARGGERSCRGDPLRPARLDARPHGPGSAAAAFSSFWRTRQRADGVAAGVVDARPAGRVRPPGSGRR